jgi:dTDP-4-dehydrorhamnose 3,5-epimerase
MKYENTKFPGVIIIEPTVFKDERGYFYECWQQSRYSAIGIKEEFVQDNRSVSTKGVLRGLHFQITHPLGQLIWLTEGKIFDVGVDLRYDSPTYKQWLSIELHAESLKQIYLPPGFAHGFCVLSDQAAVHYKCTDYYYPEDECGLLWNDLPINWPINCPIISEKDQHFLPLVELINQNKLPIL